VSEIRGLKSLEISVTCHKVSPGVDLGRGGREGGREGGRDR